MLVLLVLYGFAFMLLPAVSSQTTLVLHFIHALAWCMIHYFGLGLLLRAQSESKFLVRHYLKNYHYAHNDGGQNAIIEAFANWKAIYNLSMCMTYGAFSTNLSSFGTSIDSSQSRVWALSGKHIYPQAIGPSGMACYVTQLAWYVTFLTMNTTKTQIDLDCAACLGYDGVLRGSGYFWYVRSFLQVSPLNFL